MPKLDRPPILSIAAIAVGALTFFLALLGMGNILFLSLNLVGIICGVMAIVRKEKYGVTSLLFALAVVVLAIVLPLGF